MVAPTCFCITLPSSGSVPSAFWEMLNWGAVDRILWMRVLCLVTWCVPCTLSSPLFHYDSEDTTSSDSDQDFDLDPDWQNTPRGWRYLIYLLCMSVCCDKWTYFCFAIWGSHSNVANDSHLLGWTLCHWVSDLWHSQEI
jgi:hypothetical protein